MIRSYSAMLRDIRADDVRSEISKESSRSASASWTHYADGGSGESALTAQTAMVTAT